MAEERDKSLTDETLPKEPGETPEQETESASEQTSNGWDWDAAVPQTDTSNITFDDLQDTASEPVPERSEEEDVQEEEESEVSENEVCIVCGKPRKNSPSDLYCNECRKKFLKTNYGVGHIILAFVMVIVAALGYFVCTSTVTVSGKLYNARQCISERRYNDALNLCSEVIEATEKLNSGVNSVVKSINSNFASKEWFTEGTKATRLIIETYANTMTISYQDRSVFTEAVEKYTQSGQYNLSQSAKIKKTYEMAKDLETFEQTIVEKLNGYISQGSSGDYEVKYDEAIKYLDSVKTESDIQKSMVQYCKFMMAYYDKKDGKVLLGFLDNAYNTAGEYNYLYSQVYLAFAWQYKDYDKVLSLADEAIEFNLNDASAYYYAVKTYIEKNDLATADKMCEKLREANPDGLDYYSTKAELLRRQSKFSEAVEICRKGIVAGSDAEIYRQQAIAYLLMSDKENALEAIKQSYELTMQNTDSGVSVESVNTVALICFLCGDTKTYDEIVSMLKDNNMELNENAQKCVKGDITFEDIFMKGSGELS